jgi:hypothetical protein
LLIIANQVFAVIMSEVWNFKASPLGTEGFFLFSYMINKPYCKIYASCIGVLIGFAYHKLLKYRKLSNDTEKQE